MRKITIILAGLLLAVAPPAAARGGPGKIRVSWFSQQDGRSQATAGARIDVHETKPGLAPGRSRPVATAAVHVSNDTPPKTIGGTAKAPPPQPSYPPLRASSPLLKKVQPYGPGSFWYRSGNGHVCLYVPDSSGLCFTITAAGTTAPTAPLLTPATIAEHTADRLTLSPGQLKTSPRDAGLTGAASWFWLDPEPATEQVSVSLAGEAVTVTAVPRVEWQFGDGASLVGGSGLPYQPGPVPTAAVTHIYKTRCLPGDQGHDPYVLPGCASHGYLLVAAVSWQISYRADGPVAGSGSLPTRTTTTSAVYPVSEARAFLVQGSSG
jgi:hypothetical protein